VVFVSFQARTYGHFDYFQKEKPMKRALQNLIIPSGRLSFLIISLILIGAVSLLAQGPKYRTFSQDDLAMKKAKAGKPYASYVCFKFFNLTGSPVNGLHARINSAILAVENSGGFPAVTILPKGKELDASGMMVLQGDSVVICLKVSKKAPGTQVSKWYWTLDGLQAGDKNTGLATMTDTRLTIEPNGGNILEHLYKRVIHRPEGLVVGIETMLHKDTINPTGGWIRYMNADRKYFPHELTPRCFDFTVSGSGREKDFIGQLRNPHVKKHNNHLLGEVHALKLAIIANDSMVTEPIEIGVTLFGDLIYNDPANPADPCNGLTIRQLVHLVDSSLSYCGNFIPSQYTDFDYSVSRINAAFGGEYLAVSLMPFLIAGTKSLDEVNFLHANPGAIAGNRIVQRYGLELSSLPDQFLLEQNYPNPFNPVTTIEFTLPEEAIVTISVYNLLGQRVATLLDNAQLDEGTQSTMFDASGLSSGIYFYRLTARSMGELGKTYTSIMKMILAK
jgi:Secretion system C-terminal sorting domain